MPASFERADLERVGFVGWRTWTDLRTSHFSEVPALPAAYVVYRCDMSEPVFLTSSSGGRFKDRDPSVAIPTLRAKWVPRARVVYIGKANVASQRLRQFARFGTGERVGHWGGRYIWQLADSTDLLVAWHGIAWSETARDYEKRLLARFGELHGGAKPFANLIG
jgi:hypothetical protein